jgi:AcrR family transcriptional regulator
VPRPLTSTSGATAPRARRAKLPPADKFELRRVELAEAALATLADLGYARTSLREIAQHSEFSHGVLHYYFTDKLDLIGCSIRHYKINCATRYDEVVASARTPEALIAGFLEKLGGTMRNEPQMHCLWYDLRAQALFEKAFREDVVDIDQRLQDMVWRVVSRYAELRGSQPHVTPAAAYALLDGLFQKYLLRHVSGDPDAVAEMITEVSGLLPLIA